MKFTIKAGVLFDLLSLMKSYMSPIDAIPSTHEILIEVGEGKIAAAMTGLLHAAAVSVDANDTSPGKILVAPTRILPILSRDKKAYVTITSNEKSQIVVTWEGKEDLATIEGGVPETFLPINPPPKEGYFRFTVAEALRAHSILAPLTMGKLDFVQVTKTGPETADFVATDEWLLSKAEVAGLTSRDGHWYLPANALDIIATISRTVTFPSDNPSVRVQTAEDFTYIIFPGGFFRSAIPHGVTPVQYEPYFSEHFYGRAVVNRNQVVKDVAAVASMAPGDSDTITIEVEDDGIRVGTVSKLLGSCSYKIECGVSGTPLPITVLSTVFARMIKGSIGTTVTIAWSKNLLTVTDDAKTSLVGLEVS